MVVYSISEDGQDDGGDLDTAHHYGVGTDLGFRLWDMDQRRRPPPPAQPAPAPAQQK